MKKSKFTGEQIAFALRQAEVGTPVAKVCRKMGVSEATYYRWKQLYGIGAAQDAAARGRDPEAEAARGGSVAGQSHAPGGSGKKV
jgi:transposase-like protein